MSRFNFAQARFNMIEQQIRPWDVHDLDVLNLLNIVKREDFVSPAQQMLAFADTELPLDPAQPDGPHMLAPKVEARVLQALQLKAHENVLEIGSGSGYMAALLAHKAHKVVTVEINPALAARAQQNLAQNIVANVSVITGNGLADPAPWAAQQPPSGWDAIVLSGAVSQIPAQLRTALKIHGRLFAIVGMLPIMQAQLIERRAANTWHTQVLFETVAQPLQGAQPIPAFSF